MLPVTTLYSIAEIQEIERTIAASLPPGTLMQRAGEAAAALARRLLPPASVRARVLVLAGPGNNGGDALVVARLLLRSRADIKVLLLDSSNRPRDAQEALTRARDAGVAISELNPSMVTASSAWDLVIDGLFGIGLKRGIEGVAREMVEAVNTLSCPILALDVPSGLDADTGKLVGAPGSAIRATHTITFIGGKPGLHTCDGRDHAGQVETATLDLPTDRLPPARAHLNNIEAFTGFFQRRSHNSHKGSYGNVIVLGGAHGMCGAPILTARAAAHCGAGRVYVGFLDQPPPYDSAQPELMLRRAADVDLSAGALVVGPGLATSDEARALLTESLEAGADLVLDADALNLISSGAELQRKLARRPTPALLTPHPLEAARLLQTSVKAIQADRLAAARKLAAQSNAIVILKGSGSVIAKPDGEVMINGTGNPGLATAGTGDVLAGVCGALLAQGLPPWQTALAATWLHGKAADVLAAEGIGPIGLTASELIPRLRSLINQLTDQNAATGEGGAPLNKGIRRQS